MRVFLIYLTGCLILAGSCTENKRQKEWSEFHNGNTKGSPEVRISYYKGDTIIKQIISFNKFGQQDGIFQTFYENGNIKKIEHYKNGIPEGSKLIFYENGFIERIEYYKNGLKEGCFYGYYENGEKRYEIKWKKNDRILATEYDINGEIIFQK
jgi:antitoxin component YwqK of YwqJK toxin-antitoxin module